jgi:hypothetical protein
MTDPLSRQAERAALASTASMETVHAAYLDLSANITDLRSRVDQWKQGDDASLGVVKEKLDRIEIILGSTAWPQAESTAIAKTKAAVEPMAKALDAKDPAAAVVAAKAFGDASHDVTHAHYSDWLPGLMDARFTPMAPHAAYLDLAANIADLRSRVDLWQKGDEASLGIAKEKLDRIEIVLGSTAWPQAESAAVAKTKAAVGPMTKALDAKDPAAAVVAAKAFGDASHDVTHAHYSDWLPGLKDARFTPMAPHAAYLDLAANITDLRSRVDQWQKGDDASLGIAKEKLDRIEIVLGSTAWPQAESTAIAKAKAAVEPMAKALDAKDPAAAVVAAKAFGDASHDVTPPTTATGYPD